MKLPDKLTRKGLKSNFDKLSTETWEYLFDVEKQNGLAKCRTQGYGVRMAWYSVESVKTWLVDRGHYCPDDFDSNGWPILTVPRSVRRSANITRHSTW